MDFSGERRVGLSLVYAHIWAIELRLPILFCEKVFHGSLKAVHRLLLKLAAFVDVVIAVVVVVDAIIVVPIVAIDVAFVLVAAVVFDVTVDAQMVLGTINSLFGRVFRGTLTPKSIQ